MHLLAYSDIRCSLATHRARHCILTPDPLSIPEALQTTLLGREVAEDDINHNESFLLQTGHDGRVSAAGPNIDVHRLSSACGSHRPQIAGQ